MTTLRCFIGYDPRQPVAYNVCQFSILRNASKPVSITPLVLSQLPIERRGLTEFTYSRFMVPWLCHYTGNAVFMDPDIIVTGDIVELFEHADPISGPVQMMKHQPRFEWPSVMLFNNSRCKRLKPEYIEDEQHVLYDHKWCNNEIGDIPDEWNKAIGYSDIEGEKLKHYTMGIPTWPETCHLDPEPWLDCFAEANSTVPFRELMGDSVHLNRLQETRND